MLVDMETRLGMRIGTFVPAEGALAFRFPETSGGVEPMVQAFIGGVTDNYYRNTRDLAVVPIEQFHYLIRTKPMVKENQIRIDSPNNAQGIGRVIGPEDFLAISLSQPLRVGVFRYYYKSR